jgi:hypothetical protein
MPLLRGARAALTVRPRRIAALGWFGAAALALGGCGGSSSPTGVTQNRGPAIGPIVEQFLHSPLCGLAGSPVVAAPWIAQVSDPKLCDVVDPLQALVLTSVHRMPQPEQARLFTLAHAGSVGASGKDAGAALEIARGVLAGGAVRAVPVLPPAQAWGPLVPAPPVPAVPLPVPPAPPPDPPLPLARDPGDVVPPAGVPR